MEVQWKWETGTDATVSTVTIDFVGRGGDTEVVWPSHAAFAVRQRAALYLLAACTPPRAGTFMYHVHTEHGDELASGLHHVLDGRAQVMLSVMESSLWSMTHGE